MIADTHSLPHPHSARLVAENRPDAILHAGDIGDLEVLERFRQIAPLFAIRGNIDVRGPDLPDELHIDLVDETDQNLLRILLLHIAVAGPRLRADAARMARTCGARVVVCGHSHVPFIGQDRDLMIFNPGSAGPRRFHLPIVFGMMTLQANKLSAWHVDCETGDRWLPPGMA